MGTDLTNREQAVSALLVRGLKNGEITEGPVISGSTDGFHIGNIVSKPGAANRVEAVALTYQYQLIS